MANIRKDVPAGWVWEDGKPKWNPSPTLRRQGWTGARLTDARGKYLERGASIDAAQAIVQAVAGWKAGALVPAQYAAFAPEGACDAPRADPADNPLSIGVLIDAYLDSNELKHRKDGTARPAATLRDYRGKLKRMVDVLAGYTDLPGDNAKADPKLMAAYAERFAAARALDVFALEPTEGPAGMLDPLYNVYWKLHAKGAKHQAFGVLACASAWLAWCHRRKSRTIHNWAGDVDRETPPGRIRPWTFQELAAIVAAADKLGLHQVADAAILAIDLNWSQVDVLNLTWDRVLDEPGGGVRVMTGLEGRQKTGRVGGVPLLQMGQRRLKLIRERQQAMDAHPIKVIHLPRQRKRARKAGADSDFFRPLFSEVRALAAQKLPSCAELTFADTRDTGISLARAAGLDNDQTASRSLHSRQTVNAMMDRAYGEIGPAIADTGHAKLDAYVELELAKQGVKL